MSIDKDWELEPAAKVLERLGQERKSSKTHGPGKSAAVVVVDMQRFFMRDGDPESDGSISAAATLMKAARDASIPVFLIRSIYDHVSEINPCWRVRIGPFLMRGDPVCDLHPGLEAECGDIVVEKKHASAFTGTSLHEQLAVRGIDTILLAGTSTSGCVRASAVEGAARHYRMMVVEECVFEHRPLSGPVALSEMADRYADVITLDDALGIIDRQKRAGHA